MADNSTKKKQTGAKSPGQESKEGQKIKQNKKQVVSPNQEENPTQGMHYYIIYLNLKK